MALTKSFGYRVLRRLGVIDFFARIGQGKLDFQGSGSRKKYSDTSSLIEEHFLNNSELDHPCRPTLTLALESLNNSAAVIVETGSSAWGTNSTLLFDSYCNSFGGNCNSVDIRIDPALTLQSICSDKTRLYCNDSVSFLRKYVEQHFEKIDLLYLDSWDVDWKDPVPSAIHGLNEYLAAFQNLHRGSLILIDDTPKDLAAMQQVQPRFTQEFEHFLNKFGFPPGKGSLIKELVLSSGRGEIIAHDYQLLIRI